MNMCVTTDQCVDSTKKNNYEMQCRMHKLGPITIKLGTSKGKLQQSVSFVLAVVTKQPASVDGRPRWKTDVATSKTNDRSALLFFDMQLRSRDNHIVNRDRFAVHLRLTRRPYERLRLYCRDQRQNESAARAVTDDTRWTPNHHSRLPR